jgi:undecaprenyl-diphosphatase
MRISHALVIGLAQTLALIPGASRAGVTITAALLCGYERREAARFSMLLSIPIVLAAGSFNAFEIASQGEAALTQAALISAVLAFVASYAAITFMMEWLRRASYMPFVIYRVALGTGLLWWVYGSSNLI